MRWGIPTLVSVAVAAVALGAAPSRAQEVTSTPWEPTVCWVMETTCPVLPSQCVLEPTWCYPQPSLCLAQPTECPDGK